MSEDKKLTLWEHLDELRHRLLKSIIVLALTTGVSFYFARWIFWVLLRPGGGFKPVYISMTEMIGNYMKVSLLVGVSVAMPYLVYHLVMFIAPGLTRREKRYLYLMLPGVAVSFAIGVAFAYFILIPPAVRFLTTFGSDIADPEIRIGSYLSVVTRLLFWIGVAFETPVVFFLLARIRVLNPRFLAGKRRYAILIAFVLAAIITPTFDPINQTLVAVPIIVLYEIGVLMAKLAWRMGRQPSEERVEEPSETEESEE